MTMTNQELVLELRRRIADPGAFLPREGVATPAGSDRESIANWGARAIVATLIPQVRREAEAQQQETDLALHRGFRPDVVAEIAVRLDEEHDWEKTAAWCGGTVGSGPYGTEGEWHSWITLPDGTTAGQGSWITLDHDGVFRVRLEVDGPSRIPDTGQNADPHRVSIVTGGRQSGKTNRLAEAIVESAGKRNIEVTFVPHGRTITTLDDLQELPPYSVVVDARGIPCIRTRTGWQFAFHKHEVSMPDTTNFPFTLTYDPRSPR